MSVRNIQLVVPASLHAHFAPRQQQYVMSVLQFIEDLPRWPRDCGRVES
jgi:hypothetical protein